MAAFPGICGIGLTLCIAGGLLDLSIGAMLTGLSIAFAPLLAAFLPGMGGVGFVLAIVVTLVLGCVCGLFNGILVAKLRVPAFLVTFCTLYLFRSAAYIVISSPLTVYQIVETQAQSEFLDYVGAGTPLGLPFSFWVMVVCAVLGTLILRRTRLGRHTLALGNSAEAARISGIHIDRTKILIYTLVGFFVGVAAFLDVPYTSGGYFSPAQRLEYTVLTIVLLGGTPLSGGRGSVFKTVVASVFLSALSLGLNALNIDPFSQRILQGLLLLFALSLHRIQTLLEAWLDRARTRRDAVVALSPAAPPLPSGIPAPIYGILSVVLTPIPFGRIAFGFLAFPLRDFELSWLSLLLAGAALAFGAFAYVRSRFFRLAAPEGRRGIYTAGVAVGLFGLQFSAISFFCHLGCLLSLL